MIRLTSSVLKPIADWRRGNLFFDPDGVGGVAQILFAVLDNQPAVLVTGDLLAT